MFSEPLTLVKINHGYGTTGSCSEEKTDIFCEISILGTKTKMSALSANIKLEASVIVWTDEIEEFSHVELRGKRYKIENSVSIDRWKSKLYLGATNVGDINV